MVDSVRHLAVEITIGTNSVGIRGEILVALVACGKSLVLAICVLAFSVAEEEVVFTGYAVT